MKALSQGGMKAFSRGDTKTLSLAYSAADRDHPADRLRFAADAADTSPLAFRLLRHQTKNALQRIIAQCEQMELHRTAAGAALAEAVQRRIILSARISDALFGLTAQPGPIDHRLQALMQATIELLSDDVQVIRTEIELVGDCPERLAPVVLQVAHEMIGNAVLHGMRLRLVGTISISLHTSVAGSVRLQVCDDGWGPPEDAVGEGSAVIAGLARAHGGCVTLLRTGGWTLATMSIPSLG
ncbi:MAG TPA: ATP-binding protein [Rhodopila sp.]|uniref:ATP-binding protein n=1 Tax=Rhodopila sp. TaxID=2480087 RepID=UPI002BFD3A85|nr:ATP-binding protein [Rhodopila sp.]HVY17844.1 ATP-binding protein [Rhodopila sp.]